MRPGLQWVKRRVRSVVLALAIVVLFFGFPAEAGPRIQFGAPVTALSRCVSSQMVSGALLYGDHCYEPSVAVSPVGRIFVTNKFGDAIGVSTDGGLSFAARAAPPPPTGGQDLLGDAIVQVDPRGRLVFSNLYAAGVQVAVSSDGGRTWDSNVLVGIGPVPLSPDPDRQWVAFGPHGVMYVVWHNGTVWSATSHDGGRSFSPPQAFLPTTDAVYDMGRPVVDSVGRVFVPLIFIGVVSPYEVAVAESPGGVDAGSFAIHRIASEASDFFPIATVSGTGRVAVSWRGTSDGQRAVRVSSSSDHGTTWTSPATWSGAHPSTSSPWIDFRDEREVDVLWFRVVGPGKAARLMVSRGPVDRGPEITAAVADVTTTSSTSEGNTDYAHFTRLPDGRIVAVWCESPVYATVEAEAPHTYELKGIPRPWRVFAVTR